MNATNLFQKKINNTKLLIQNKHLKYLLTFILFIFFGGIQLAQNGLSDLNFVATSSFVPTIKDAIKFTDLPEIKDSVNRISNIKYGITSVPLFPKYEVQTIEEAKLANEPLPKLYNSLLKLGYGPFYTMPYGEFWIANNRSRENNYGAHVKHLSSTAQLEGVGNSGYSNNKIELFGKQFYKKHTLSGEINYDRRVIHYYGFDTSSKDLKSKDFDANTKQRYQLIEPKLKLQSHYSDSVHINHTILLSYYNLQNQNQESENNIKLKGLTSLFINKEKLNVNILTDYYNHKQSNDTINDLIISVNPSFEAKGNNWNANVGLAATINKFDTMARFYFYPQINFNYDIYENIIIPYAGVNGGLIKNSFKQLTTENPFIDSTLRYANTNNKYNLFLGLKGNLSSNTSYDARVTYSQFDSLHFFVVNYNDINKMYNRFNVIYDNASLLNISGQINYQLNEKLKLIAKGDYNSYNTDKLARAYHKPSFFLTFTGAYNLRNKIIVKADLFFVGSQWALSQNENKPLKGYFDGNIEAEYRYTKTLSFFARFNNIANQRYYQWERLPSQRFNMMIGLSFIPF
jgi:hypothetical protein